MGGSGIAECLQSAIHHLAAAFFGEADPCAAHGQRILIYEAVHVDVGDIALAPLLAESYRCAYSGKIQFAEHIGAGNGRRVSYGDPAEAEVLLQYGQEELAAAVMIGNAVFLLREIGKGREVVRTRHGQSACVYTSALSMTGAYHLTTFTDLAQKEYRITDHYGSGEFFLSVLQEHLRLRRISVTYAPSVPCPDMLSELYLPAVRTAVTLGEERGEGNITNINMHRFIDKDALSMRRARIRFAEKCRGEMMDGALQALSDAASAHFALEEIYKSAMDFDALAAERKRICEEIAERLGE